MSTIDFTSPEVIASIITAVAALILGTWKLIKKSDVGASQSNNNSINNNPSVTINNSISQNQGLVNEESGNNQIEWKKNDLIDLAKTRLTITFIDDDSNFQVVKILKRAGWDKTNLINDISSFDIQDVRAADILFIDVQGIGKKLGFSDEGLGVALEIKKRHPEKKVCIYSAESSGNRFHNALRNADDFLPKNAEPYEFINVVERFATAIMNARNS